MMNLFGFLFLASLLINIWLLIKLSKHRYKSKQLKSKFIGLPPVDGFFSNDSNNPNPTQTQIFAHRGLASYAHENTGPAIMLAAYANIKAVEIDIRFTKDLIPILYHDSRIIDNSELVRKVSELSFQQTKTITVLPLVYLLSLADFFTHLAHAFDHILIDLKDFRSMDNVKIKKSLENLALIIPEALKNKCLFDTANENAALMILKSNLNACIRKPKENVAKYYSQGFRFFMITIRYARKHMTEKDWQEFNFIVNCRESVEDASWAIST